MPDTPLGKIVSIRTENDKEILKHFTPDQKRIRTEWMNKQAKAKTLDETMAFVEEMKQAFIRMSGGGGKN